MENHKVIGKGGNGTIYWNNNIPNYVVKMSNEPTDCVDFKHQFKMQNNANEALLLNFDDSTLGFVGIPRPLNFRTITNKSEYNCCFLYNCKEQVIANSNKYNCCFKMEYIRPIKDKIIQVKLGNENFEYDHPTRGLYLGTNNLKTYLENEDVIIKDKYFNDLAYSAGILIGTVHFIVRQTALDTELVLGLTPNNEVKLFLIDFDQSKEYDIKNPDVEALAWSLEAEEFYPFRDSEYYNSFESGYFEAAKKANSTSLASKILDEMNS
jgi:hypothetical protein